MASSRSIDTIDSSVFVEDVRDGDEDTIGLESDTESDTEAFFEDELESTTATQGFDPGFRQQFAGLGGATDAEPAASTEAIPPMPSVDSVEDHSVWNSMKQLDVEFPEAVDHFEDEAVVVNDGSSQQQAPPPGPHPDVDLDLLGGGVSKQPRKALKDARITEITYEDDDGNTGLNQAQQVPSMEPHPDVDFDLLGGVLLKQPSKAVKDAKITKITYLDGDGDDGNNGQNQADLLTNNSAQQQPGSTNNQTISNTEAETKPEGFVDEEVAKETPAAGGGLFSRLRNRIPMGFGMGSGTSPVATTSPAPAAATDASPDLEQGGNSLPHPATLFAAAPDAGVAAAATIAPAGSGTEGLNEDGNSLPHPHEVQGGGINTNGIQSGGADFLDDNGNSLPHPEEVARAKSKGGGRGGDKQHDEIQRAGIDRLDDNGNSLPHPDEVARAKKKGGRFERGKITGKEDTGLLDENGNSLPHPGTPQRGANAASNNNDSESAESDDVDIDQLLTVLNAEPGSNFAIDSMDSSNNGSDSSTDSGSSSDSNSSSNSSNSDDNYLDGNGNSLPHPDTMRAGARNSSSRWTNLRKSMRKSVRNSVRSTFRASSRDIEASQEDDVGDDGDRHDPTDPLYGTNELGLDGNSSHRPNGLLLSLDGNGNSLPAPEQVFSGESDQNEPRTRASTLSGRFQSLGRSVLSTLGAASPLHSNAASPRDQDRGVDPFSQEEEEVSFGNAAYVGAENNEHRNIPMAYEVERFDDENNNNNRTSLSQKERIQNMIRNPRRNWRKICLAFAIFLIFLGMLIPLITLARERRKQIKIGAQPTPAPVVTAPPIFVNILDSCEDEIVLVDSDGNDIGVVTDSGDASTSNTNDVNTTCYTTEDPIYFRFKRCRPSSPLDWIGIYGSGSMFMDRLWKRYHDGVYLCGAQPCPLDDVNNKKGRPPREEKMRAPPIEVPGEYQLYLVKDSLWPYEFIKHTRSFKVVHNIDSCQLDAPRQSNAKDRNRFTSDSGSGSFLDKGSSTVAPESSSQSNSDASDTGFPL